MSELLNELMSLLDITIEDIRSYDNKYKMLIKQMRVVLKALHPDSGGNEAKFNEAHCLYERLLFLSKNDENEKYLNNIIQPELEKEFIGKYVDKKHNFVKTTMTEIVNKHNLLNLCNVEPCINRNLVSVDFCFKSFTEELVINQLIPYKHNRQYSATVFLAIKPGTTIELHIDGFDEPITKTLDFESSAKFIFNFDKNDVHLKVELFCSKSNE